MRRLAALLSLVAVALAAPTVAAQGDDASRVQAERLFEEATALMEKYDFAAACPKLEEVVKLQPQGIGAKLKLAECQVSRGKLLRAMELLDQAASLATAAGQPERAASAQERRKTLEARLGKLTISLEPGRYPSEALRVIRDGRPMDPRELDQTVAVDPGPHKVEARAAGKKPFGTSVIVAEGATQRIVITLDVDTSPAFTDTDGPEPEAAKGLPAPEEPSNGVRTAGWVIGGTGLALGTVGAVLGITGIGAQQDAVDAFVEARDSKDDTAKSAATGDHDSARTQTSVGWVLAGTGAAAVATGVLMIVLGSDDAAAAPPTGRLLPWATPSAGGGTWAGAW